MPKIFRNYNTLSQFNTESTHPENKICFIKDNGVIYSNGVQYSPYKMDTIANIEDSDNIVDKFNELRKGLLKSNLMAARTPHTVIYWTGDSNTINISGTTYTAELDKINIDGVVYYQLKLYKDLDNNFYKFSNNTFANLIFKDVDTSKVTNMNNMFHYCNALTSLDVSKFDTSKVTNMSWMFEYCMSLTSLDLSTWDTSKVTNMNAMFLYCSALTSLDLSGFDTSKVTDMSFMFSNCSSLTSLDLSGWDTSNVNNMRNMFSGCSALKTIRMVGCLQTTIDKIKAQLSSNGITGCTIVTE
jgi:surface protein